MAKTRVGKHWTGNEPAGASYEALTTIMWGYCGEIHAGQEIPPFPMPGGDWYFDDDGDLWFQSSALPSPPERHPGFPDREGLVANGTAIRTDRKGRKAATAE